MAAIDDSALGNKALDDAALDEHAERWRRDGWTLFDGLIPEADIDAAVEDSRSMFAPPEVFHAGGDDPRIRAFYERIDPDLVFGDASPTGPAFRREQLLGIREFPFPAPRLNALVVHPHLLRFARTVLAHDDIRVYLAQAWAKYSGVTNYEQPLHRDTNHSLIPIRSNDGWSQMEGFIYLSDVDDDTSAPTRLVSTRHTSDLAAGASLSPVRADELTQHEVAATGRRGSFLAYRPDVWHRATNLTTPDGGRFVLATGLKRAGADWIGFTPIARHAPNQWFQHLVATSSVDQLSALGIPEPGHGYWTSGVVEEFASMYPGLDVGPWLDALG